MYLAEIHGKLSRDIENKEDVLTSNVFSFFKYADREIFLYPIIKSLGIDVNIEDARDAQFHFWPHLEDHTEPDLVLIIGDNYLLIESKYFSGFGEETQQQKHQLVREIEGGNYEAQNLGKRFYIIAITADYFLKPEISQAIPKEYQSQFRWINWQWIAFMLQQIIEKDLHLSLETQLFAKDLFQLLLKKHLRNYEGIKTFSGLKKFTPQTGNVFFEASTANYRGDFIGFLNMSDNVTLINTISPYIFFDAVTANFRGDFIGFKDALEFQKKRIQIPSVIFFRA